MITDKKSSFLNLPLDVASRLEGLFLHIEDTKKRATLPPALSELIADFENLAYRYIAFVNQAIEDERKLETEVKWRKVHEAVDKLINEWGIISTLVATNDLGSAYLDQFDEFLDQAQLDLGLTESKDRFVLFPTFGNYFALTSFRYSKKAFYMLKLPISTLSAPWEWSVIWHELASIKVRKIRKQIEEHIKQYAFENNIHDSISIQPMVENRTLVDDLFNRILKNELIDEELLSKLRMFFTSDKEIDETKMKVWPVAWFEQLFEDACSVLAFGDNFLFVLEKILRRNPVKLSSDRKHPNLEIRLQVANRINERKKGSNRKRKNVVEKLTDELLWNFIVLHREDKDVNLPVAFENQDDIPAARKKLIDAMNNFRNKYDQYSADLNVFRNIISSLAPREHIYLQSAPADFASEYKTKFDEIFPVEAIAGGVNSLLALVFSSTDELDIRDHNHNVPPDQNTSNEYTHSNTYAIVHGQTHDINWASHI